MSRVAILEEPGIALLDRYFEDRGALEQRNALEKADPFERRAVEAVKAGDPDPYDYLVRKYMKRVVSIAWSIVRNGDDAEDLAQEAFVKAYQTIGRFRTGEPFGPWIHRIVTNLAL